MIEKYKLNDFIKRCDKLDR